MLRRGDVLGHFEILGALGAGGMGEVYVARDQHLGRKVAVKVLPDSIAANAEALERLEREAKTLAGISHPNILTIHDFASEGTVRFAVTELLDGEDLRKRLGREGAMPLEEALHVAIGVARGLASAHEHHVVHRDIKPANVFLESSGSVKVLDFGLARSEVADLGDEAETAARVTRPGVLMGTVGYMSPEQIRGQTAGPASDVFSLGCLLYEMLTGKRPFDRPTTGDTLAATLAAPPTPVADHGVSIHAPLRRILERALAKDPATRYPTAIEMCVELEAYAAGLVETPPAGRLLVGTLRRPRVAIPLLLLVAVLTFLGVRAVSRSSGERWARRTALPEVRRLVDSGEQAAAYALASEAEAKIPGDAGLEELFAAISERIDVTTEPPGAEVSVQRYAEPESEWRLVGTTPLTGLRMPLGIFRWRFVKDGYETRLSASRVGNADRSFTPTIDPKDTSAHLAFVLDPQGSLGGMVAVDAGPYYPIPLAMGGTAQISFDRYLIGRTEVTNREFKEFIDAGGYSDSKWWTEPFVAEGRELDFAAAMERLRDSTGRAGPAEWVLGAYPEGEDDHPVGGVSWYEASAYAAFRDATLPTVFHWIRAALASTELWAPIGHEVVALSNFGASGVRPVAERPNVGITGAYDMPGNVREWTSTAIGEKRYVLGGAWDDPSYFFALSYEQDPWQRPPENGLRLVRYVGGEPSEELRTAFRPVEQDIAGAPPMSDDTFKLLARLGVYDPTPLNATIDATEELGDTRLERVSIDAAYDGERLPIALLLPTTGKPPYHAVVFFGGMHILFRPDLEPESWAHQYMQGQRGSPFLVKEGRALILPIWEGAFERNSDGQSVARFYSPNARLEMIRHWRQDLARTLDYLSERPDIRADGVAYMGFSLGTLIAPDLLPFEKRIGSALLLSGGFSTGQSQEGIDRMAGLVRRITIPTLMLGSAFDTIFPPETHQRTFFELLGTLPEDKRLRIFETGGHAGLPPAEVIKECLAWLEKYQGPVERKQRTASGEPKAER